MQVKSLWMVLGVLVLITLGFGGCYNGMVNKREAVKSQWAQVENVLQRRFDLIPNLVNTVKGYTKHEKELLENITQARSQWGAAKSPSEKMIANQQLDQSLARLLLVVENYPQLKANENFLKLQDELAGTENRITVERMRYNEAVKEYNVAVQKFPANLLAGFFGFKENSAYFQAKVEAQEVPKVQF